MNLVTVIIISILVAVIIITAIILVKTIATPKKVGSIQRLIKDGKLSLAEKTAKSLLAKNDRDFVTHYWLGKTYLAEKKQDLAYAEFKIVNENALFNGDIPEKEFRKDMAELYTKFNDTQSALKEYLLLTKLDPQNADHCYNAGHIYEITGDLNMAKGFYQKAITIDKRYSKAHTALGAMLFRGKKFSEAKKEFETALKINPNAVSNYYYLGKILKENKDYSNAIKTLEKAERDQEFRQKALIEKGSCYMMVDHIDNAIAEYSRAIQNAKSEGSQETLYARYFLAACYEKTRKLDKAIEQWEQIHKRNKKFRDVATKLSEYKELQSNDSMKEYMTASTDAFLGICKKTAASSYSLACQKIDATPYGCTMLATEDKKDSWMNGRKQIFLVDFYRGAEPVEEGSIRKVADTVKSKNYFKAIVFSSSGFSAQALKFAENRPVVLVGKDQLEGFLAKAGI